MWESSNTPRMLADVLKDLAATSEATAEMMATYVDQLQTVLAAESDLSDDAKQILRDAEKPFEAFGESNLNFARECGVLAERARNIGK